MTEDGISAMRDTAKAFIEQIEKVRREAAERTAELSKKGMKRVYKEGEKVSFFIPPSEKEANDMGRKPKHMLQYRGPATIVERLSNTSYQLEFEGRTYYRCFQELRKYKSHDLPVDLPMANGKNMQVNRFIVGNFVTLCDTDDPQDDLFHLCKVTSIEDDRAVLLNYGTWGNHLRTAKFGILYQEENTLRYTTAPPKQNRQEQEVVDKVSITDADGYIDHYDIKMTKSMKISAKSIRELSKLGLRHHILGRTFP